jgi:hypothetical protein
MPRSKSVSRFLHRFSKRHRDEEDEKSSNNKAVSANAKDGDRGREKTKKGDKDGTYFE